MRFPKVSCAVRYSISRSYFKTDFIRDVWSGSSLSFLVCFVFTVEIFLAGLLFVRRATELMQIQAQVQSEAWWGLQSMDYTALVALENVVSRLYKTHKEIEILVSSAEVEKLLRSSDSLQSKAHITGSFSRP